ncbi:MAG: beta strand repeat-containing protein [Alphaproteobacteria bacterium]
MTLTGDVAVNANGDITFGNIAIAGHAFASASETGSRASAWFSGFGDEVIDDSADAEASFVISNTNGNEIANGDVTVNGDISVVADADVVFGTWTITGSATASAESSAFAEAGFTGVEDEVIEDEGFADADIRISNTAGDVTLNGNVLASADATLTFGDITITGGAFAFANDHATAYASFIGFSSSLADSGASASASVDIRNTDGNVTVNGDVTVAANAAQTVGNIAISGTASAQAPRDGHAFANFDGFDNDVFDEEASARASFFIGGFGFDGGTGGDVSITGDITVDAGALIAVGNLGITGAAIASASGSWGSAEASFVGINGDVADDEASATAEFDIRNTVGDVTIDGGVTVTADADETAGDITLAGSASAIALNSGRADAWFSGIEGSVFEDEASAFASFLIAGTGGNVLVTGGIAVDADATIMVGDLSVTGTAFASASGPGASASANFTGFEDAIAGDEAFASASFDIGSTEGDVTINGLISVTADADNSAGDITVAGGKTVEGVFVPGGATAIAGDGAFASAEFRGFDSDVADSAEAWASIDIFNTGGNVTLNGGVTASVDANVAVGNATIAGSAIAVVLNSGSGYGGHANADFTGVEEDLTDGAFATADVDIINTTGNLTVANGITVNADGTISIGDVSVNGLAKAFVGGSGSSYFTNAGDAHASFTGFGDELAEDEAELFASLDIASVGGNLVIDGGINVTTDTSITIGTIDITGSALAFVSGAGMGSSSQSFGGVADANFTGIDGEVVDDEPEGEGFAEITGVSGDTTINGGITVAGTGVITVGDITITGLASAATTMGSDGYGGHGFADASFTGIDDVVIEDEGFAGAELYIDVAGDLTVNGGIDVDGFAAATVGNVSITGTANAASSMMALDGIYNGYGGGVSATFTGIDDDIMESGAEAFATTDIFADGNIVLTGGVSTDAEANVAVAGVTVTGAANVSGTMLSSPYGSAHAMFTGVDGQIAASATADAFTDIFASGSGGIIITGGAATNADATVGVGDVTVTGTTGEPSGVSEYASFIGIGGDLAGSAFADAFTDIEADNGGEGFADITIIGGAMTAANATIDVGAISETLNGTAVSYIFDGGDTVTGGAFAEGFMEILAAQHEGGSGDIFIAGDTTVDATATVTGANGASAGYGPAFAIALGVVDARNDVTLVPTAGNFFVGNDIRASAVADTAGSEAVAFAAMIVEAGERQLVAAEPDGYGGQVLAQYFLDGDLSEVVTDDGNLFIKGDVLSFASANAETAGDGDGFFGEGFGGEAAAALLSLAAHGDPANGAGNFTNEFFTHEPQAIARLGGGASAFTDATQSDLDDTESNDVDGTPFTFVETDPSGLIPPVTEGEIHLPSDSFGFFGFFDVFGLFEGEFESAVAAATFVHWHGEANIFQMPMGGEGPDPYLLIKETPDIPPGTPPAPVPGGLALLPGQTVCSLGEDGTTIKSDGQFLFAEFFFEQSGLEFGKNGCEEVVSYPATADQLP